MDDNLRKQIHDNFNLRPIDELVEIWVTNDRVEWSDTAFEVIAEILGQRLGNLPSQNPAVLVHVEEESNERYYYEGLPGELLEQGEEPIFYEPKEVLWMSYWLNWVAIASIVITVIVNLTGYRDVQRIVLSFFSGKVEYSLLSWFIGMVLQSLSIVLTSAFYYFLFRGLAMILTILMEMEFNSRISKS